MDVDIVLPKLSGFFPGWGKILREYKDPVGICWTKFDFIGRVEVECCLVVQWKSYYRVVSQSVMYTRSCRHIHYWKWASKMQYKQNFGVITKLLFT